MPAASAFVMAVTWNSVVTIVPSASVRRRSSAARPRASRFAALGPFHRSVCSAASPVGRCGGTSALPRAPGASSQVAAAAAPPVFRGVAEPAQPRLDCFGDRLVDEGVVSGVDLRRERLEELGWLQRRAIDGPGGPLGRDADRQREQSGDGDEPGARARHRRPVPVSSSVCRRSTGRSCHDQRAPPGIRTSTDTGPAASPSPNSGRRSDCDR